METDNGVNNMEENKSHIDYSCMRPKKAITLKNYIENGIHEKTDLQSRSYENADIIPLKRFSGDKQLFGRGRGNS